MENLNEEMHDINSKLEIKTDNTVQPAQGITCRV